MTEHKMNLKNYDGELFVSVPDLLFELAEYSKFLRSKKTDSNGLIINSRLENGANAVDAVRNDFAVSFASVRPKPGRN